MTELNYLARADGIETLDAFARKLFAALGIDRWDARESSHYRGGSYLRADVSGSIYTVAHSDEVDHDDLPFWLNIRTSLDESDRQATLAVIDARLRSVAIPTGMRFARLENFGRRDELRIDL